MARKGIDVIDYEKLLKDIERMKEDINELKRGQAYRFDFPLAPEDKCTDGLAHDYPFPWHSIEPAHCKKCGKQGVKLEITY